MHKLIEHGVISENGTFLTTDKLPTEATQYGGAGILRKVNSIVEEYLRDYHLKGICISTAGMVDSENGKILYSAPLIPDYTGTPIKEILEKKFCLPCEVENDVNCAALAEYYAGAAKPYLIKVPPISKQRYVSISASFLFVIFQPW